MATTVNRKYFAPVQQFLKKTDWKLLVFLLLFLNVKILIKLVAIVFIYITRPGFRFGFRFKASRLPLFYLIIPAIGLFNYLIYAGFAKTNYSPAFFTGIVFWVLCILAVHQVKLAVESSPPSNIHRALFVFFVLNIIASAINLLRIEIEIGEWNPYIYQGMYQKYFIGTGDYIKGISFDTSTTNAVINAFGIFYFLTRKQFLTGLCCMTALLLTCSNFVNIAVLGVFVYCFIFQSTRVQKSMIIISMSMLVLFLAKVSPQNNDYAVRTFQKIFHREIRKNATAVSIPIEQRPDSALLPEEKKYKIAKLYIDSLYLEARTGKHKQQEQLVSGRPLLPVANIHTAPYQHKTDSSETRLQVLRFAMNMGRDTSIQVINSAKVPGKVLAMEETIHYLHQNPGKIFTGAGIGNFSSKLAFRTTGLQVSGGYPASYAYINDAFRNGHLAIFLDYFDKDSGFHSITNSPNNVYVQLLSEYGVIGLLAFLFFYLWFFAKAAGRAIPLILLVCCVLTVDYWFEQLSVIILFELLLFLDKKEKTYQLIL